MLRLDLRILWLSMIFTFYHFLAFQRCEFFPSEDGLWLKSKCFFEIFIVYIVTLHFKKVAKGASHPCQGGSMSWWACSDGEEGCWKEREVATDAAGWLCSFQMEHTTQIPDIMSFCCPVCQLPMPTNSNRWKLKARLSPQSPSQTILVWKRASHPWIHMGKGLCRAGSKLVPLGLKVLGSWGPCRGNWIEDYAEKEHALSISPTPNPMRETERKAGVRTYRAWGL